MTDLDEIRKAHERAAIHEAARDDLLVERDNLRAEIERLRAAVREFLTEAYQVSGSNKCERILETMAALVNNEQQD